MFGNCFRSAGEIKVIELKQELKDFELAYRTFERELIGNMLHFNHKVRN